MESKVNFAVVVPWHNEEQKESFLEAWKIETIPEWLILQQDQDCEGCAVTKNRGMEIAHESGAEIIIVLDDDCYPTTQHCYLQLFISAHLKAFDCQLVELYEVITDPPSRGTPYFHRSIPMPVAATMGFWSGIPDLDAASQLRYRNVKPMTFVKKPMFQRFFAFSGMNCAFRSEFWPYFKFVEGVGRFDDIYMGYRLQREAYRRGYCINLNGPMINHIRQSNVWNNLKIEVEQMERNETEWMNYLSE